MTYRTPENLIRQIMAESHAPALKIPEPERVQAAIDVLHANGATSAARKDDNTISVTAAEVNKAADILDRAIMHGAIKAKPIMVSAEAIDIPDSSHEPVEPKSEPHPPEGGQKLGEAREDETEQNQGEITPEGEVKLKPRSLNNRMQTQYKKIDEAKQLDEISYTKLKAYTSASFKQVNGCCPIDKRIERRKAGLEKAQSAKIAKVKQVAFAESVSPINTVLRVLSEGSKLRLIATHNSDCGKHSAKVYKDAEWGEHRVKFFIHGKHHEPADYHTHDVNDAHDTARSELKRLTTLNGALKEAIDSGEDLSWLHEEVEQVDEVTKGFLKNYLAKNNDHQDSLDREMDETGGLSRRNLRKGINREKGEKMAQAKIARDGRARIVAREEVAEEGNDHFLNEGFTRVGIYTTNSGHKFSLHSVDHDKGLHLLVNNRGDVVDQHRGSKEEVHEKLRAQGLTGALHESEQIDEISNYKIASYTTKAAIDMANLAHKESIARSHGDDAQAKKYSTKGNQRFRGLILAQSKIQRRDLKNNDK